MMDKEFQKNFRFFPKVFHTHFSSTAECLAFEVTDVQRTASEAFCERPQKRFVLFDLQISKFYENGPPTASPERFSIRTRLMFPSVCL